MRRPRYRPPNDIEAALDDLGLSWRASGSTQAKGTCPSPDHDDSSPSWYINLETGLHFCMACGYKGNWHTLVRDVTGKGAADAERWTRERQTIGSRSRVSEDTDKVGVTRRELVVKYKEEADLWRFSEHPPAKYVRKRRLTQEAITEYGVLWDAETDSWIIPVRDPDTGELWGWQEKGERDRFFRNTPFGVPKSRTLFGLACAEASSTAVLVESPLDAVRLRAAGISGAVSGYGVQVSDRQVHLLRSRFDRVLLALDNDRDGMALTAHLLTELPRARAFNYQGFTKQERKDPGEMSDDEVREGIDGATGPLGRRLPARGRTRRRN